MRLGIVLAAALIASASFGLTVEAWLKSEAERCRKFADLAAECIAPQGLAALILIAGFAIAVIALVWLALSRSKSSDKS